MLWSAPRTKHRTTPPLATHPAQPVPLGLNTSRHAMTRSNECFRSTQTCCVATRSARSSWAAVLAFKVSREGDSSLSYLLSRVQDVFNLLDVRLLSRIEHQLLEVLSSQPAPTAPQPRPRISLPHSLCAPMRCAGAGLADAHGRRAISSLRRRALRRGCGRAPRAAHAGRELDGESSSPL